MSDDKKSINIMHISDIHCGIDDTLDEIGVWRRKTVIDSFNQFVKDIPSDWKPDIIAITGDLGWRGEEEDYKKFGDFLTELLDALELTVNDVICCPGNHDKYLPAEQEFPKEMEEAGGYYSVSRVYDHMQMFVGEFAAYCNALRQEKIPLLRNKSTIEDAKFLYGYRIIKGLCFVVFNSAWLCDWRKMDENGRSLDRGNLTIDENMYFEIINMDLPHLPTIAMYHHPKEWLKESEIGISNDLPPTAIEHMESMVDIVLNGHMHMTKGEKNRDYLHYVVGTISSNDVTRSECVLLKIFIDQNDAKLIHIDEAECYSQWHHKKVKWYFEINNTSWESNNKHKPEDRKKLTEIYRKFLKDTSIFKQFSSEEQEIMERGSLEQLADIAYRAMATKKVNILVMVRLLLEITKTLSNSANNDAEEKERGKALVKNLHFSTIIRWWKR